MINRLIQQEAMVNVMKLVAVAGCGMAPFASAAVISAPGSTADQVFHANGTSIWVGQAEARIGSTGNATTQTYAGMFVFQLPELPAGEEVVSADFTVVAIGGNDWRALYNKSIDLYALRVASAASVLASDYFAGPYGTDDTDATGIQESFLFQPNDYNGGFDATLLGQHSTDGSGDASLGSWLNAVYAADPGAAGKYVFLRVNTRGDISPTSARYWSLGSMNNATVSNRPTLTLTTDLVPEPGALMLVGGALAMLQTRRRAK